MMVTARRIIVLVALVIVMAGVAATIRRGPDRQAIYEACMASIPGSATNFDDHQACTDKANAAR